MNLFWFISKFWSHSSQRLYRRSSLIGALSWLQVIRTVHSFAVIHSLMLLDGYFGWLCCWRSYDLQTLLEKPACTKSCGAFLSHTRVAASPWKLLDFFSCVNTELLGFDVTKGSNFVSSVERTMSQKKSGLSVFW